MRKLCIFAIFLLLAGGMSFLYAGGKQEAPDDTGEPEEKRITIAPGGSDNSEDPAEKDGDAGRDWSSRIGDGSSAVPKGKNRRSGVEDRIVAKKEPAAPAPKEETRGLKLDLPFAAEKVPDKPVSQPEPAAVKETAAPAAKTGPSEAPVSEGGRAANFQTTGFSIGGSATVSYSMPASSEESVSYSTLSVSVRPKIGFMIIPKLALTVTPSLNWRRYTLDESIYSTTVDYGLSAGVMYYFFSGSVFIPALGGSFGFTMYPENEYQTSSFHLLFSPDFYAYLFVTDNIAPFAGVHADISSPLDDGQISFGFSGDIGVAVFLPKFVRSSY